jgi:creatinine amidohydrolase/Fe(II)-dependent formamide hydrolase-like protein
MFAAQTPWFVPAMSFLRIQRRIVDWPGLILPVAGMEPAGEDCPVGAGAAICFAIADRLSAVTETLLSPPCLFSYTTPYRVFAGCAGIRQSSLSSSVSDISADFSREGVKNFFIFDGTFDSGAALNEAAGKSSAIRKDTCFHVFSWQTDRKIREYIKTETGVSCSGRCEYGILSMAAATGLPVLNSQNAGAAAVSSRKNYETWFRRGRDPEKFASLFPSGRVSFKDFNPDFGKKLIDMITAYYTEKIKAAMSLNNRNV